MQRQADLQAGLDGTGGFDQDLHVLDRVMAGFESWLRGTERFMPQFFLSFKDILDCVRDSTSPALVQAFNHHLAFLGQQFGAHAPDDLLEESTFLGLVTPHDKALVRQAFLEWTETTRQAMHDRAAEHEAWRAELVRLQSDSIALLRRITHLQNSRGSGSTDAEQLDEAGRDAISATPDVRVGLTSVNGLTVRVDTGDSARLVESRLKWEAAVRIFANGQEKVLEEVLAGIAKSGQSQAWGDTGLYIAANEDDGFTISGRFDAVNQVNAKVWGSKKHGVAFSDVAGATPHFEYLQVGNAVMLRRTGAAYPRHPHLYDLLAELEDVHRGTMLKVGDRVGLRTGFRTARGNQPHILALVTGDGVADVLQVYLRDQLGSSRQVTSTLPNAVTGRSGDRENRTRRADAAADGSSTRRAADKAKGKGKAVAKGDETAGWPDSFVKLWANRADDPDLLLRFRQYLERIRAVENLDFLGEVEEFRSAPDADVAASIYARYVRPEVVNVSSASKAVLDRHFGTVNPRVEPGQFDRARQDVLSTLAQDSYPRFKNLAKAGRA
ncbi:regulator of G-protein signaling domain-containing protein [Lentzea sp. NPDC051208]|uniref:regulator of G-protein signaling domain-containing protein n=1 Tax=Lentzea sp. NPDC051208 TaxID=3154642 RepID=UPI00341C8C4C